MSKPTEDDVNEFLRQMAEGAQADVIPKMKSSIFVMGILAGDPDPFLAMQLGLALLLDKPLILIATGNTWIPQRLRQLAVAVVEGKTFDADMQARTRAAIEKLLEDKGLIQ